MTNCISERHVLRGRKAYYCHECEAGIDEGQPRSVYTYVDGHLIYSLDRCKKCEDFLDAAAQWRMAVGVQRAKSLHDALYFPDGREQCWLKESFEHGIEIDGTVFHDWEAATNYLLKDL